MEPAAGKEGKLAMIYQCSLCSFSTGFSVSYQNHLKNVHGTSARKDEAQPTYFCELCSVSAPDKRAYQQHLHGKKHKKACVGAHITIRPRRDNDSTSDGSYTGNPSYLVFGSLLV